MEGAPQVGQELYLPGAASLMESLDRRLLVVLRDGRHLVGTMRSYDQFSNMVLEHTVERTVEGGCFADMPLGLYMVRGDSVVLLGETADDEEARMGLRKVSMEDILEMRHAREGADDEDAKPKAIDWDFEKL